MLQLNHARLEFTCRARNTVTLPPFSGCTLRGAFGRALRQLSCITQLQSCPQCPHQGHCAFALMWEISGNSTRGYDNALRPYVVRGPIFSGHESIQPGESFSFQVKLFGSATLLAVELIEAMRLGLASDIGRGEGRLSVERVVFCGAHNQCLFSDGHYRTTEPLIPKSLHFAPSSPKESRHKVRLICRTPLALKHRPQGSPKSRDMIRFDPRVFTTRLADRFERLCQAYQEHEVPRLLGPLIQQAQGVEVLDESLSLTRFQRYSNRSKRRVPMKGLMGEVHLNHVPSQLAEFWQLAEAIHVGKQTVFGFGEVRVEVQ